LQSVKLDGVVGSVKWPICNQNVCVSVTFDTGAYLVFDIRQSIARPAFQATLGKSDLYTHERYTDHHVIMGFGDGEMQHIDMRISTKILHKTQDPYVEGIGMIDYHPGASAFVVSGFTDFSVWKQDPKTGLARVQSHMLSGHQALANSSGFSTCAQLISPERVLMTTSSGMFGVFMQDFSEASHDFPT